MQFKYLKKATLLVKLDAMDSGYNCTCSLCDAAVGYEEVWFGLCTATFLNLLVVAGAA